MRAEAFGSDVRQNVYQLPERIAHKESAHAPGLVNGTVSYRDVPLLQTLKHGCEIVDLDGRRIDKLLVSQT